MKLLEAIALFIPNIQMGSNGIVRKSDRDETISSWSLRLVSCSYHSEEGTQFHKHFKLDIWNSDFKSSKNMQGLQHVNPRVFLLCAVAT